MSNLDKNSKKNPFAMLSKAGFAAVVLGSTVAGPFVTAHAAEDNNNTNATDDKTKTSEGSNGSDANAKGINVNVPHSDLDKAVKEAKDAGVKVKECKSES